ncbi:MAG: hypothetical protein JO211_12505, partial [Acidobacteriaceae bacterium]|nr:hypothetical protein [Acidobacteriaceae bacterium]
IPHRELNEEEDLDYRAQSAIHGPRTDTLRTYLSRLLYRARFIRFFFVAPLYLALLAFVITAREYRFVWSIATLLIFALGTNFYPYFYPHYVAAIGCLCVLASVCGLERLSRLRLARNGPARSFAAAVVFVCIAQFIFWYGVHAASNPHTLDRIGRFETWNFISYGDSEGRMFVDAELAHATGQQLVFVRYAPWHAFHEWVHNDADIDHARVVWARDLGAAENEKLRVYYPQRRAWLLEPDKRPPKLSPYLPEAPRFEEVR